MLCQTKYLIGKNQHKNKISVEDMKMLCLMCGTTRHDKIINDNIIKSVGVTYIVKNMIENRLWWFEHVEKDL